MGRKKNWMDIWSDNLARLHTRRPEHGYKKETSREIEALLIAAQNNAMKANYIKVKFDNKQSVGYVEKEMKL